MTPNVQGNRAAAPMVTEGESMNRRVRLTVGLGVIAFFGAKSSGPYAPSLRLALLAWRSRSRGAE